MYIEITIYQQLYYSDGKEEVNREVFFENLFENLYLLSNEKAEE